MAETVGNPPSLSKKLAKQWKWVLVAVAIVVLAVMSSNADLSLGEAGQPTGETCRVEVNADILNVRAGPGADTALVDKLNRGDVVEATSETSNGFRRIGTDRWVASEFVTVAGQC
ncbi:MAG TPA: SH3 domain-containing protein [Pseudonocardiaceae bacterium]